MLLIEQIFKIINDSGLDYCIQNKYEMMPESIPSDIDIMYKNANEKFLDKLVGKIIKETNGILVQKYVQGYYQYTYIIYYKTETGFFQIPLDFYRAISWSNYFVVMMAEEMLDSKRFYKCFYVPDYYVELKYMWIRRTIKKDLNDEHLKISEELFRKDMCKNSEYLKKDFGDEVGELIVEIINTRQINLFYTKFNMFERAVKRLSKKNDDLRKRIANAGFLLTKILPKRIIHTCGISIGFLSPDGGGKSTIINELCEMMKDINIFDGVKQYYFRPKLLKNLGHYNRINPHEEESTNSNPHGKVEGGLLKSFVRFMFYNCDFILGTVLKIWPDKMAKKLVLFDRYYYDYYVDIKRYQYGFSKKVPRLFSWMIPTLDIVFVLDAPSDVLYARKQELSIDELLRQRDAFQKIPRIVKSARIIDVNRNVTDIVQDINEIIVELQSKRTKKIFKGEC